MDERFKDYEVSPDGKMVSCVPKGGGAKFPMAIGERAQADRALLGYALGRWDFVFKQKTPEVVLPSGGPTQALSKADMVGTKEDKKVIPVKAVKKDKIAWLEGSTISGGAELSGRLVRKIGEQCGFDIELVNNESDIQYFDHVLNNSDLIILNNLFGLYEKQMFIITEAIKTRKYVKYEHDHRELDRPDFAKGLFQNSVLNVFLSPIHLENYKKALGCDGIVLPLAIDVDFFKPVEGVERMPKTALVSNVRNFKTWNKLQSFINGNQDVSFTVLTNQTSPVSGENVKAEPIHPYEEMPSIYSAYQCVVHLLDGWGAGERVIFEGALCGCKIVSDERAGHMSWNKDLANTDELRTWLGKAPFEFWREIGKRI